MNMAEYKIICMTFAIRGIQVQKIKRVMVLAGKNVIITGATSGIGKEALLALAGENANIVMPVRNLEKGGHVREHVVKKTGNSSITPLECNLSSLNSIRRFAAAYKKRYGMLHLLINNAGTWQSKRKETEDSIEMNFGVNHLAPFLMTNLLLDELRAGAPSRIINVSSNAHMYGRINFNDLEGRKKFSGIRSYGQSKLANILFTRHLAEKVKKDNITVNCMHPGVVATNLFDQLNPVIRKIMRPFMISPRKGAETLVYLSASPDIEKVTGEYFIKKKVRNPFPAARNKKDAERLWEISREYTGL
jgi:NAD(P)-dependent dehydrogenase (short-subunit alcohol dehydrogenase family)